MTNPNKAMRLQDFLLTATERLHQAGVETARLDILILLEDVLGSSRAHLLAHPEQTLSTAQLHTMNNYVIQRGKHLPLAYIRGQAPFYGRYFSVNNKVLVPRPETEAMIDLLKEIALPPKPYIADVGTGSGCLGITAAIEIPEAIITLIDIDDAALNVAKQNADTLGISVSLRQQSLLGVDDKFDVLLANLPYVPDEYPINRAASHEPPLALFGGRDGLDLYRTLWRRLATMKYPPAYVLTESLLSQHGKIAALAKQSGHEASGRRGLIQKFILRGQPVG